MGGAKPRSEVRDPQQSRDIIQSSKYEPIRRNDMKQSDTYKEIAAAYQIKEFHSRGNVIVRGFRSQTPTPQR